MQWGGVNLTTALDGLGFCGPAAAGSSFGVYPMIEVGPMGWILFEECLRISCLYPGLIPVTEAWERAGHRPGAEEQGVLQKKGLWLAAPAHQRTDSNLV